MTFAGERNAKDRLFSFLLAAVVALLSYLFASGDPSPALWDDLAVAAGVRPAAPGTHSLWLVIASSLIRKLPNGHGFLILRLSGPLALGFLTYAFVAALQKMTPEFLRIQLAEVRSHRLIRWFIVIPVTALFVLSDPVWRLGEYFTPDTLHVLLAFLAFYGFITFFRMRLRRFALLGMLALGLLLPEEPFAVFMTLAVAIMLSIDLYRVRNSGSVTAHTDGSRQAIALQIFTYLMILATVLAVYLAWKFFSENFGVVANTADAANGEVVRSSFFAFVKAYWESFLSAASAGGWVYVFGVAVVPMVIAVLPLRRSMDIEQVLDYRLIICYLIVGALAYLQLANFSGVWLWQDSSGVNLVHSAVLHVTTMLLAVLTVAYALSVMAVEVYFRARGYLARTVFAEDIVEESKFFVVWKKCLEKFRKVAIGVPYVLVAVSFAGHIAFTERSMRDVIGDFVRLAADDCEGSPIVITDGAFDTGLELEMCRRGVEDFKALSMMASRSSRETYLRRRGEATNTEDYVSLGISTAAALRDWVRGKSPRATNLVVQLGFELWRHDRLDMPEMGATAARTGGFAPGVAKIQAERAHILGERMIALAAEGAPKASNDAALRRLWNCALWRLARTARMRSDAADKVKDLELAKKETQFADDLDDVNLAYEEVRRSTEWVPRQVHSRFTPREGLRFALHQADFVLASTYARQILAHDEKDFHANFAMGMYYVTGEQYSRAEMHLKRAVAANPKDAAVLNNLAMVEIYLGRLESADEHVKAALRLAPDVPAIKRTQERIHRELKKQ